MAGLQRPLPERALQTTQYNSFPQVQQKNDEYNKHIKGHDLAQSLVPPKN
jgi:hypothetical protein